MIEDGELEGRRNPVYLEALGLKHAASVQNALVLRLENNQVVLGREVVAVEVGSTYKRNKKDQGVEEKKKKSGWKTRHCKEAHYALPFSKYHHHHHHYHHRGTLQRKVIALRRSRGEHNLKRKKNTNFS